MKYPDSKILIFCKAPVPGNVKTRLLSVLSPDQATELHQKLATETITKVLDSHLCPVEVWCCPDIKHPFFQSLPLPLKRQYGSDLGERMKQAFQHTLEHCRSCILIGTDCPSLTKSDLETALYKLEEDMDVVIAPAEDGGYPLIGMKRLWESVFDVISWGTSNVLSQTRNRIDQLNLRLFELPMQWDVDRPEDLQRYLDSDSENF